MPRRKNNNQGSYQTSGSPPEETKIIGLEDGWKFIHEEGILQIQNIIENNMQGKLSTELYSRLYSRVYDLCIQPKGHNYSSELYQLFDEVIKEYLETYALPALTQQGKAGTPFLQELVKRWKYHKFMTRWMCALFMYLDRFYVKRTNKKTTIEVCTGRFRDIIFDATKKQAVNIALQVIYADREKKDKNRELLYEFREILIDLEDSLRLYEKLFEKRFLKETADYFKSKCQEMLDSMEKKSCPEYLTAVENILNNEETLVRDCLHESTLAKVNRVLYKVLLLDPQAELLKSEFKGMNFLLESRCTSDLKRIFRLYKAADGLELVAKFFEQHVRHLGRILFQRAQAETQLTKYIESLMLMHKSQLQLIRECFQEDQLFHKAMQTAFGEIVNAKVGDVPFQEILSTYCDFLLRNGGKEQSQSELFESLDQAIALFKYIGDKDMFAEVFRKSLSKRLLSRASASDDAERMFITKMKFLCGAQFTSKLEGMINDMGQAKDQQKKFQSFLRRYKRDFGFDFNVTILTNGYWPDMMDDEKDLCVSQQMKRAMGFYENWYLQAHSAGGGQRKLQFLHSKGSVVLGRVFKEKQYTFEMSTIQASLLLMLNQLPKGIQIQSMIKMLKISPNELKRHLKPLCSKKFKILNKIPPKSYDVTHKIQINEDYTSKSLKVKIPLRTGGKKKEVQREKTKKLVLEDRKHAVEASIVRVMKSRQRLQHQKLIAEVSHQLLRHFTPDPKHIKQRIEHLISLDYIRRDEDERNVYVYVA